MVVASDSGIDAGAIQHMGREKLLRAQGLGDWRTASFVHLVESAGANLLKYRVEGFVNGGAIFYNLAKLLRRGPAGGDRGARLLHCRRRLYAGLSDYVIMVRGRAKAFLAGPPLLKAGHGRDRHRRGAWRRGDAHACVRLGEYLARDDSDGVRLPERF
jgi:geranyl-CoA carboxylase beta subunit